MEELINSYLFPFFVLSLYYDLIVVLRINLIISICFHNLYHLFFVLAIFLCKIIFWRKNIKLQSFRLLTSRLVMSLMFTAIAYWWQRSKRWQQHPLASALYLLLSWVLHWMFLEISTQPISIDKSSLLCTLYTLCLAEEFKTLYY